ncbi:hypothetical protein DFH07DRAFT_765483 [Mycena maculata]|uniref:Uncharacterized protein n=1 Tax=Mycena maculata TaxID=230809 RepID=A0AAD7KCG5_9AGAR|nr:hypothetical protein DFH07DRAFT_765483 [Mycena maculata]
MAEDLGGRKPPLERLQPDKHWGYGGGGASSSQQKDTRTEQNRVPENTPGIVPVRRSSHLGYAEATTSNPEVTEAPSIVSVQRSLDSEYTKAKIPDDPESVQQEETHTLTKMVTETIPGIPVIYLPNKSFGWNHAAAFQAEDATTLQSEFTDGGQTCAIYSPDMALGWLEAHFNHPLLASMRSVGIEGPIAVMLGPDEPSLEIFGNVLDEVVWSAAKQLSETSDFPVLVKPTVDNPIPKFNDITADPIPRSGDIVDPVTTPGPRISTGKAFRLRGGASSDEDLPKNGKKKKKDKKKKKNLPMPEWTSPNHIVNVQLELDVGRQEPCNLVICMNIRFETQPLAARNPPPAPYRPGPEVSSSVNLDIIMARKEFVLDRSHSSIGFLVHRAESISNWAFDYCGFDLPAEKKKQMNQKTSQKITGLTAGFAGGKPTAVANVGYTRGSVQGVESADEKPMPKCDIRADPGKSWEGPDKDYKCYDLSWKPAADRAGVPHEMRVEFGLKMNIYPDKNYVSSHRLTPLWAPDLANISFILRHQIMVWVYDPNSLTKARGILVLTSTYIPNIRTEESLSIRNKMATKLPTCTEVLQDVFPRDSRSEPTAGDQPPAHDEPATSVSVGTIDGTKFRRKPGIVDRLRQTFTTKSKDKSTSLPIYETVSRGWDATNNKWMGLLWPELDKEFHIAENPDTIVWKLDWKKKDIDHDRVPLTTNEPIAEPGPITGSFHDLYDRQEIGSTSGSSGANTASTAATSVNADVIDIPMVIPESGENEDMEHPWTSKSRPASMDLT